MSVAARHHAFSFADYLRVEEDGSIKHEFLDGVVWAMSGGTPRHAAISANIATILGTQLRDRSCQVFSSDLRVRVRSSGLTTYPDVTVICGQIELDADDPKKHTITNPSVIIEVLSPSTEAYDRGDKLAHYQTIPSVREIVLIAHDEQRLEVWQRTSTGWTIDAVHGDAVAELPSIGCRLANADVYRNPLQLT